ncbi:epimerase family protein SDR39U1 [Strongylocentrotus purpuratus]|uniref:Epimerase family protein SDR39U1 n=1 Tax=Strongylocentrotus purpuratus TaxID=7668 RepID=A0A7M7N974_STRPU|nr:epimerase family protein SDR39U1 [Strongylocentrotus purpuratus]
MNFLALNATNRAIFSFAVHARCFSSSSSPQNMIVLIGGGTGFIGTALRKQLEVKGHKALLVSRSPGKDRVTWDEVKNNGLPQCDAVVNLTGENILNPAKRWTEDFKQVVWKSRVETTATLAEAISKASSPPSVFVGMSGVGYYPSSATAEYTEESMVEDQDYLGRLCVEWERSMGPVDGKEDGVRRAVVRTAVVLGKTGGAMSQMKWPFYFGVGGIIGSGQQYFPWIHIDDIAGIFVHAIENESISGVLNGIAPNPVTNHGFTKALGAAMWRPTLFPLPGFVVKGIFGDERAVMLLEGQKVLPKRTLESGFNFRYPDINSALKEVVS